MLDMSILLDYINHLFLKTIVLLLFFSTSFFQLPHDMCPARGRFRFLIRKYWIRNMKKNACLTRII